MIREEPNKDIFSFLPNAILVCTVNCKGAMGKGVALKFKEKYPLFFNDYKKACQKNEIKISTCLKWQYTTHTFITFPTKTHWALPSKYEYIKAGLPSLRALCEKSELPVILPRLGCGNGGLDWIKVKEIIYKELVDSATLYILL